jgi:phage shock protein PspC (stress-responsive transcriptional regulator)
MKKTLQINIGGLSFTVEEDAYEKLSQYLESIQKYFSSYESCEEITADIEGRIAEKFFIKAQNGGIIAIDDVNNIITSMGSVADFEAIKEDEDLQKENTNQKTEPAPSAIPKPKTSFYKDGKRKVLGGVLAGLAHKLEVDAVWLRILFVVLAFGLIDTGVGGFFFLAYLVCWIAFPECLDLEENVKIRKFYRNPENKVLGGVATGLATYLRIDLVVIRILFVISGFFGIGILLYIIFWIIVPPAHSLTQKMELKGQPLTLENIETSIKSSQLNAEPKPEGTLAKLLLFPFRLIGIVLKALGQIASPLGTIIKILVGLLLLVLGATMAFATIVATAVFFGVVDNSLVEGEVFIGMFVREFPTYGGVFAFLVTFIPSIALTIFGLSLITRQVQGNRNFWLTSLALWFVGVVGTSVIGTRYGMHFARSGEYSEETTLTIPKSTLYLDVEPEQLNDEFIFDSNVVLTSSENDNLTIEKRFSAKGQTEVAAMTEARNIVYNVAQKDSVLIFDNQPRLKGKQLFRNQRVETSLRIPKGLKFKMTSAFAQQLWSQNWRVQEEYNFDNDDIEKYTFEMGANDEVICQDCPKLSEDEKDALRDARGDDEDFFDNNKFDNKGEFSRKIEVSNFEKIDFGHAFVVLIKQGNVSKVEAFCDNKEDLDDLQAKVSDGNLKIDFEDPFKNRANRIQLIVTTPSLSALNISGAAEAKVFGFEKFKNMDLQLSGSSRLAIEVHAEKLNVDASGASSVLCKGNTGMLHLVLSGASRFLGKGLVTSKAQVDASGASEANLSTIKDLQTNISGGSTVNND